MPVPRAFSLAGPLQMKLRGGALTILRSKKRYYFALDEINECLAYYKDEADLIGKKEPFGEIQLHQAAFTTLDDNERAFVVHVGEKQIELEADNTDSCECWMEALARRYCSTEGCTDSHQLEKPGHRTCARSISLPDYHNQLQPGNDFLRPPVRRLSYDPDSESSVLALSVLEERLHELGSEIQSRELSREQVASNVPPWLDDWVTNWLHQQNCHTDCMMDDNTSTPSSPYRSLEGSTCDSDRVNMEELVQLRMVSNQQKLRIHELSQEKKLLEEQNGLLRQKAEESTPAGRDALMARNRFQSTEIIRLNKKCIATENSLLETESQLEDLRSELDRVRREYVFVLQSTIRIPLHDNNSLEVMQVKLLGGDMHKLRINKMASEARLMEPSLATMESLLSGLYVDVYGFRQHFPNESLALHYMATQLHEFYQGRTETSMNHKRKWKEFLEEHQEIKLTQETRALCRAGIPNSLRPTVWRLLIHQQVEDIKSQNGKYYYRNLCSFNGGDADRVFCCTHQKQINLDLLRTMPGNVHFMSADCKGVTQLQQVLRAFCLHNGPLGYCQGMNFLAATALLFVGPEDAFWFLVAMTEKYFDKSYFDANLAGAQADQEVLKELLEQHYPAIARHLSSLDVDLATITLNWFIALFFDAIPFQTLLRIWDSFLLEGPKVLFRFAIVLLGSYEEEIIGHQDTIGIMKVIKAGVKLCYDVDGMFKKAFEGLTTFPSRGTLRMKQMAYLEVLKEQLSKREKIRNMLTSTSDSICCSDVSEHQISDIFVSDLDNQTSYIVAGNQSCGRLGIVREENGLTEIHDVDIEFDCRVASLVVVRCDMLFVSLISGYLVAVHMDGSTGTVLWELKLPDMALRLRYSERRLYAALASGTLTVLENVVEKSPTCLELYHLPIGSAPLADLVVVEDTMWIATACKLVQIETSSLCILSTVYVACSSAGVGTPFFEKITCLCSSEYGLFLTTAHSTLIQLWRGTTCTLLFDITFDHTQRKPSLSEEDPSVHIVSLCYNENILWAGTSDGYVIMYSVEDSPEENEVKYCLKRYPSGRRLSPKASPGGPNESKVQLCYIPTKKEARGEEQLSRNEFGNGPRKASKVSISIDQDTQQYSVTVNENNNNNKRNGENEKLSEKPPIIRRNSSSRRQLSGSSRVSRRPLHKGFSADSAVSVLSSETTEPRSPLDPLREHTTDRPRPNRSSVSSNLSMEYDDIFEMYSDEDQSRRQLSISSRKGLRTYETSNTLQVPRFTFRPTLRRKDLAFDDPLVIAVTDCESSRSEDTTLVEDESEDKQKEIVSTLGLALVMKLKISDKPVRRIVACGSTDSSVVLSCAGGYGEEESLLAWKKEPQSGLWINDPVRYNSAPQPTSPTFK